MKQPGVAAGLPLLQDLNQAYCVPMPESDVPLALIEPLCSLNRRLDRAVPSTSRAVSP